MLKLTKYEFRKNMSAPAILLIVIGILEIVFLCCLAVGKESYVGLSFGIQSVVMMFSYFIILVLSISSYSRELKSKSSYMTFMAPVSTYKNPRLRAAERAIVLFPAPAGPSIAILKLIFNNLQHILNCKPRR